ncbi:MAG TPA: DUF1127 domain-containing protein [Xanthobacteraceae bacterium]|nr:DUF1127 domain-containing protein [Xanthobacteraceae bacterium]
MAAIIGPGSNAWARIRRWLVALLRTSTRQIVRLDRAMRNRQAMRVLARMDDRMLADIGLSRGDLQDAYAQSLWRDPGNLLRARALERRLARLGIWHGFEAKCPHAPSLAPKVDDMALTQARKAFCSSK